MYINIFQVCSLCFDENIFNELIFMLSCIRQKDGTALCQSKNMFEQLIFFNQIEEYQMNQYHIGQKEKKKKKKNNNNSSKKTRQAVLQMFLF